VPAIRCQSCHRQENGVQLVAFRHGFGDIRTGTSRLNSLRLTPSGLALSCHRKPWMFPHTALQAANRFSGAAKQHFLFARLVIGRCERRHIHSEERWPSPVVKEAYLHPCSRTELPRCGSPESGIGLQECKASRLQLRSPHQTIVIIHVLI
jgi:hypothetical protein